MARIWFSRSAYTLESWFEPIQYLSALQPKFACCNLILNAHQLLCSYTKLGSVRYLPPPGGRCFRNPYGNDDDRRTAERIKYRPSMVHRLSDIEFRDSLIKLTTTAQPPLINMLTHMLTTKHTKHCAQKQRQGQSETDFQTEPFGHHDFHNCHPYPFTNWDWAF